MAPRRRPPKKAEIDISQQLAEALAEKPQHERHQSHETPSVGDTVAIGSSDTEHRVSYVSPNGREVNLELPGTNIERYRVPVNDLNISGRVARKPAAPPKPRIDADAGRERIERAECFHPRPHARRARRPEEVAAQQGRLRKRTAGRVQRPGRGQLEGRRRSHRAQAGGVGGTYTRGLVPASK